MTGTAKRGIKTTELLILQLQYATGQIAFLQKYMGYFNNSDRLRKNMDARCEGVWARKGKTFITHQVSTL